MWTVKHSTAHNPAARRTERRRDFVLHYFGGNVNSSAAIPGICRFWAEEDYKAACASAAKAREATLQAIDAAG